MAQVMLTTMPEGNFKDELNDKATPRAFSEFDQSLQQAMCNWFQEQLKLPKSFSIKYAKILLTNGVGSIDKLQRKLIRDKDFLIELNNRLSDKPDSTFDLDDIVDITSILLASEKENEFKTPLEATRTFPHPVRSTPSSLSSDSRTPNSSANTVDAQASDIWQQSFRRLASKGQENKRKLSEFQSPSDHTTNLEASSSRLKEVSSNKETITSAFQSNPNITSFENISVELPYTSFYYFLLLLYGDLSFKHRELDIIRIINSTITDHVQALIERGVVRLLPSIFSLHRDNIQMIQELLTTFQKLHTSAANPDLVLQQFVSNDGINVLLQEIFGLYFQSDESFVTRILNLMTIIGEANDMYLQLIMNTNFIPKVMQLVPELGSNRIVFIPLMRLFIAMVKLNPSLTKVRPLFAHLSFLPWLKHYYQQGNIGVVDYLCQTFQLLASLSNSASTLYLTKRLGEELEAIVTNIKIVETERPNQHLSEEKRLLNELLAKTYRDVAFVAFSKRAN